LCKFRKVKKHHRNEFLFGEVVARFQELSYFDQHLVTATCGQAVIEMVQAGLEKTRV
jgi:mediator of RNA polymerase II transcription subunit 12